MYLCVVLLFVGSHLFLKFPAKSFQFTDLKKYVVVNILSEVLTDAGLAQADGGCSG